VERKHVEQINVLLVEVGLRHVYWLQAGTPARYGVVRYAVWRLLNNLLPPSVLTIEL
jgi:hypothetical protein